MLPKRFKLVFLTAETSRKKEFNFSKRLFITCISAFALAFLLISITTGILVYHWYSQQRIRALAYQNRALEKQLVDADGKVAALEQRIDRLAKNGSDLRAFAHLPVLDPGMQQMGIGGSLPYEEGVRFGAEELLGRLENLDRQINLQEKSLVEIHDQIEEQTEFLRSVPSIRPVVGGSFSSLFGRRRDPFTGQWEPHMGVDIVAPTGTPIYATADGKVVLARREPAYGKTVVIDHGNGYKSRYAHLHRFYVAKGQRVKRGDPIGEVGSTGRSTGPHLHYEVIVNNQHRDPLDFMFDGYAMARIP